MQELNRVNPNFVDDMEAKLERTKHKVGTPRGGLPVKGLLAMLKIEVAELEAAIDYMSTTEVKSEAVDVANFALLIYKRVSE